MSSEMRSLEEQIQRIQRELAALGDLRPGTLSRQFNVCGKAGCSCKAAPPKRHGPYFQISFTWRGRSRTQFVRQEELPTVERQLHNYAQLRKLLDRWIEAGMRLSQLRIEASRATTSTVQTDRRFQRAPARRLHSGVKKSRTPTRQGTR